MSINAGGGGGSSTLAHNTDVSINSPATGQFLRYNGTAWQNYTLPVGQLVRATRSTTQSISTAATDTAISFDAAPDLDWAGWVVGSPTRITFLSAGTYSVKGTLQLNNSGTSGSRRYAKIVLNGTTELDCDEKWYLTGAFLTLSPSVTRKFAVNDYVEFTVATGAGTDTVSTFVGPYMEAMRLD